MLDGKAARLGRQVLIGHARTDFHTFQRLVQPEVSNHPYVDAVHLRAICWELQQMVDGASYRLAIAVPPRHFKSYLTSVAFPAFMLGLDPTHEIVCATYGLDLADMWGRSSRQLMLSRTYQEIFPDTRLVSKTSPADHLVTTRGGYRHATSTQGTVTGLGAELLVYDDPHKAIEASSQAARDLAWEWLTNAPARITKSQGRIIVAMQRLHADDVIGRLKEQGLYKVLELPAEFSLKTPVAIGAGKSVIFQPGQVLFPKRFSAQVLKARCAEIGEAAYNAQYLQQPAPPGGKLFKIQKFKRFDLPTNNKRNQYEAIILSVDPGVSSEPGGDPTALTIWGVRGLDAYLLAAERGNWAIAEQIKKLQSRLQICHAAIIERSHIGIALMSQINGEAPEEKRLISFTPSKSKFVRAETAALFVEKGRVFLPYEAPWLAAYEKELALFPYAPNDDFVDSTSQFFLQLDAGFPYWLPLKSYKSSTPQVKVSLYG